MVKYADAATLFASKNTDVQLQEELNSITRWASDNKLTINRSNIKELVFHRPHPSTIYRRQILMALKEVYLFSC